MHIHRKAYQKLLDWKTEDKGTTSILIEGARRVGKTYLAREFAKREYKSFIYIDFSQDNPIVREIIENYSYDLDDFFRRMALLYKIRLFKRQSCFIFDEIQLFPKARQLIKHLVADGRYDYIQTGSLISLKRNIANIVIPSEVVKLDLLPLSFEEFLEVIDEQEIWNFTVEQYNKLKGLGEPLHRQMIKLFREYLIVGGMPQAVSKYADDKDLLAVRKVQKNILEIYRDDIAKYATGYELKVRSVFDAIPSQLAQHDKRFVLSQIYKHARMRTYEEAFMWLSDSKIAHLCFNSTDPSIGLQMNLDNTRLKCYMADTGLLTVMSTFDGTVFEDEVVKAMLYGKLGLNEGMFFENVVAQMLRASGHKLFFHTQLRDDASHRNIEIDFLIRKNKKICPIEVKSSRHMQHSSLDFFVDKYRNRLGQRYIICTKDLQRDNDTIYLPVYMTELL